MSAERDRQILQHNFIMINERARVKRAETQRIRDHAFQYEREERRIIQNHNEYLDQILRTVQNDLDQEQEHEQNVIDQYYDKNLISLLLTNLGTQL